MAVEEVPNSLVLRWASSYQSRHSHGGLHMMHSRSRRYLSSLVLCSFLLSGCFQYSEAPPGRLPSGENVKVYLTRAAADIDLLSEAGVVFQPGLALEGEIASWSDDMLFLRVPTASRQVGVHQTQLFMEVGVTQSEILRIERRDLARSRSAFAVAGLAGIAIAVVVAILKDAQSPPPPFPGDNGGGDENRVPQF